jgi:hypothetical protein
MAPDSPILAADMSALESLANGKSTLPGTPYNFTDPRGAPNLVPKWATELNRLIGRLLPVAPTRGPYYSASKMPINNPAISALLALPGQFSDMDFYYVDDGNPEALKITSGTQFTAQLAAQGWSAGAPYSIALLLAIGGDQPLTIPNLTITANVNGGYIASSVTGSTDCPGAVFNVGTYVTAGEYDGGPFFQLSNLTLTPGLYSFSFTSQPGGYPTGGQPFAGYGTLAIPSGNCVYDYSAAPVAVVGALSGTQVKMVTGPRNSPAITGYPNGLPIGLWDMGGAYPIAQAVFEYATKHTGLWCGISSLVAGAVQVPGTGALTLRLNSLSHRGDLMPWNNPVKVWLPCLAIAKNQQIVDTNGNLQTAIVAGTTNSSGTPPVWPSLTDPYFNPIRLDGSVIWCLSQFVGYIIGPAGAPQQWFPGMNVTAGQLLLFSNFANFAYAVTGGVTGTHQPSWPGTGQIVQDGTVEWQMNEVPNPAQSFNSSRAPLQNCLALIPRYSFTSLDLGLTLPTPQSPQNPGAWIERVYLHRNKLPTTKWGANIPFPAGTMLLDSNGNLQISANSGVTGANVPPWSTRIGGTTKDTSQSSTHQDTSITWLMSEIYVELGCLVCGVFTPFQNPNPITLPAPYSSPPTTYFQTQSAGQELWLPIFDTSLLVYTTKLGPQPAELLDIQARLFNMESTIVQASTQGIAAGTYAGANLTVIHWPVRASAYADLTALLNLIA